MLKIVSHVKMWVMLKKNFKFYPCFPAYPSSLLSLKSIFSIYYECVLGNNLVHHYHPIRLQSWTNFVLQTHTQHPDFEGYANESWSKSTCVRSKCAEMLNPGIIKIFMLIYYRWFFMFLYCIFSFPLIFSRFLTQSSARHLCSLG